MASYLPSCTVSPEIFAGPKKRLQEPSARNLTFFRERECGLRIVNHFRSGEIFQQPFAAVQTKYGRVRVLNFTNG